MNKLAAAMSVAIASVATAQTVTIYFDNSGAEAGVTEPGKTEFSVFGSNWSGGIVTTVGSSAMNASGAHAYRVVDGFAQVSFDVPVAWITFFFVYGEGVDPSKARAFDAEHHVLATVTTNEATVFGDPGNYVTIAADEPISLIWFRGGVIDNVTFPVPIPAPGVMTAVGLGMLVACRRRR